MSEENTNAIKLSIRNTREVNEEIANHWVWHNPDAKDFREATKNRFGFDMMNKDEFPVEKPGFSWRKVAIQMGTTIKEADASTGFVQVLRAGVNTIVNNSYKTVKTSYEDWVHVVASSKKEELYAPIQGIGFLSEVGEDEIYPESKAAGLDIKLTNRKYGHIYPVTKELLEDDQTGQFKQQAGLMGQYAKLALEAIVMIKLSGVAGTYSTLKVPATETKPTEEAVYPYTPATTPFVGGGFNRPATFAAFSQAGLIAGNIALKNQLNKLGLKMSVDAKRVVMGPTNEYDARIILNSAWYPSVPSAVAGTAGWTNSVNPVQGAANLTISRFIAKNDGTLNGDSKAWYLMDDSVPWFVLQIRESASVVQEAPNSGKSFEKDVVRFKLTLRANADHIDPRFVWQGNDGSV